MTELLLTRGSSYCLKQYRDDNRQMREPRPSRAIRPEKAQTFAVFGIFAISHALEQRETMRIIPTLLSTGD